MLARVNQRVNLGYILNTLSYYLIHITLCCSNSAMALVVWLAGYLTPYLPSNKTHPCPWTILIVQLITISFLIAIRETYYLMFLNPKLLITLRWFYRRYDLKAVNALAVFVMIIEVFCRI